MEDSKDRTSPWENSAETVRTNGEASTDGTVGASTLEADTDGGVDASDGAVEVAPSHDDLFEALSNRRRRHTIHYLKQRSGETPTDISELSTQLAAWEQDVGREEVTYADRKNVHTALYQFHAPKLDELGLANYDRRRGKIELTEHGRKVDLYVEAVTEHQIPWSVYFLGLSGLLTVVVGAVWLDVPPFTLASDVAWAAFVSVTFLISSAVFVYYNRYRMRVGSEGPPPEVEG